VRAGINVQTSELFVLPGLHSVLLGG
jgi:hypothetical protein